MQVGESTLHTSHLCVAIVDLLQLPLTGFLHFIDLLLQLALPQLGLQLQLAHIEVNGCQGCCHRRLRHLPTQRELRKARLISSAQ